MPTRILHKSFVSGVLSHDMFSRVDDAKYNDGAEILDNFIVKPQGVIQNRAGFYFVAEVKDSSKYTILLPFVFSSKQAVVIELGEGYFRFHIRKKTKLDNTGKIYEVANNYKEKDLLEINYSQSGNALTLVHKDYPPAELRRNSDATWSFKNIDFSPVLEAPTGVSVSAKVPSEVKADTKEKMEYLVVAINKDEIRQSPPSEVASAENNIYSNGATNTIKWTASKDAHRYNVYKKRGGLFGYIGSTQDLELVDNNIAPDMSITPAIYRDDDFADKINHYPSAVSYINQRRIFGGTNDNPSTIWLTKTATDSDLSYSIPSQATDRIKIKIAARELTNIRHIVALKGLVALTDSSEWQLTVEPDNISAVPESYIGSSLIQPIVVNDNVVYITERGNFLRNLYYDYQSKGYNTENLSIRSSSLFDNVNIYDMSYSKFPEQIVWSVLSDGSIVSLAFLPDHKINAFSRQITNGAFESCTSIPEDNEDYLYTIVKRKINGVEKRYIERMESREKKLDTCDYFFVDSGLTYNGKNTTNTTVTINTENGKWDKSALVKITAGASIFTLIKDTKSKIIIDGVIFVIYEYVSDKEVKAYPQHEDIKSTLQNTAVKNWELQRTKFRIKHLVGKALSILADGAVHKSVTVDKDGYFIIETPVTKIHAGLGYVSKLKTLPLLLDDEALGRGKTKNINKAWVRILRTSGFWLGSDFDNLSESAYRTTEKYGRPQNLKTELVEVNIKPSWDYSGQICAEQRDCLPVAISGITLEVSIGG
jgi:hypothetical protein